MNALMLALAALRGVATLLSNPALGGGASVRAGEASELLSLLGSLIEEGADAFEELKIFTEGIQAMADANRGPTPTEWNALRARAQDAHDRLQAVKAELEPEPEPEVEEEDTDPTPTPESASEAASEAEENPEAQP